MNDNDKFFFNYFKIAFSQGPILIQENICLDDLKQYVKDKEKITNNDITGSLAEWLCVNKIFKGICSKIKCIKYVDYRDLKIKLNDKEFSFELKTHTPWFTNPIGTLNRIKNTWNVFKNKRSINDEMYYVGFWSLRHFGISNWYGISTNNISEVLFDIAYILRMQDKKLIYVNRNVQERYKKVSNYHLDNKLIDKCFSPEENIYNSLKKCFQ